MEDLQRDADDNWKNRLDSLQHEGFRGNKMEERRFKGVHEDKMEDLERDRDRDRDALRDRAAAGDRDRNRDALRDSHRAAAAADLEEEEQEQARFQREQIRRSMADPSFLKRKAAIDMQNSMLKIGAGGRLKGEGFSLNRLLSDDDLVRADEIERRRGKDRQRDSRQGDWGRNEINEKVINEFSDLKKKRRPLDANEWETPQRRIKKKTPAATRAHARGEGEIKSKISVLGSFDVESYLEAQRMKAGEGDKMKKFQFNQVISDATPPDRYLRDYRNSQ